VTCSFFVRFVLAAVGLIVLAGPAPVIGQSTPSTPPLRILVTNNYDGLSRRALSDAKEVTEMLFAVGGLRIEWVDQLDTDLPLIIAFPPAGGAERLELKSHVLAQTFHSSTSDGPGGRALVFVDRVAKRAESARIEVTRLLAAVIAHELGHMLLADAHSETGLMRPHWGDRDLQLIEMGALRFSAGEPDRIRRELEGQMPAATTRFEGLRPMEMCPCSFSKISMTSPW
jgi:hypothetical protein